MVVGLRPVCQPHLTFRVDFRHLPVSNGQSMTQHDICVCQVCRRSLFPLSSLALCRSPLLLRHRNQRNPCSDPQVRGSCGACSWHHSLLARLLNASEIHEKGRFKKQRVKTKGQCYNLALLSQDWGVRRVAMASLGAAAPRGQEAVLDTLQAGQRSRSRSEKFTA